MKLNFKKLIINFIIISFIFPLIILALWSITSSWIYPDILPKSYSLRGFEYILSLENIKVLLNSLLISSVVVILTLSISIPAAKALTFYDFKGKKFFEMLILSPIIIPVISISMGVHIFFIKLGLANTYAGVILINILPCIPYAVRIIGDVYKLIGNKLEIQSRMLGASSLKTFIYITLPLISPGIIGASSMCFIISFSQYFLTMLIGGGNILTYPMVMFPYIQSGDRAVASVYSMVFLIISVVVLVLIERKLKSYYKKNIILFD